MDEPETRELECGDDWKVGMSRTDSGWIVELIRRDAPTGAIATRSNGAPIKLYVELVSSLLRVRRENPRNVAARIARRTEERVG